MLDLENKIREYSRELKVRQIGESAYKIDTKDRILQIIVKDEGDRGYLTVETDGLEDNFKDGINISKLEPFLEDYLQLTKKMVTFIKKVVWRDLVEEFDKQEPEKTYIEDERVQVESLKIGDISITLSKSALKDNTEIIYLKLDCHDMYEIHELIGNSLVRVYKEMRRALEVCKKRIATELMEQTYQIYSNNCLCR